MTGVQGAGAPLAAKVSSASPFGVVAMPGIALRIATRAAAMSWPMRFVGDCPIKSVSVPWRSRSAGWGIIPVSDWRATILYSDIGIFGLYLCICGAVKMFYTSFFFIITCV